MLKNPRLFMTVFVCFWAHTVAAERLYIYINAEGEVIRSADELKDQPQLSLLGVVENGQEVKPKVKSKPRIYLNQPQQEDYTNAPVIKRGYNIKHSSIYDNLIEKKAAQHGLDPNLIKAIIRVESAFKPDAVSSAGAQGLMQLMPATAKQYNVKNSFDPDQNIVGGILLLKDLIKKYGSNLSLVLAAYNAGQGAVGNHDGIPPYKETRGYVMKVLHFRDIYQTLNQ